MRCRVVFHPIVIAESAAKSDFHKFSWVHFSVVTVGEFFWLLRSMISSGHVCFYLLIELNFSDQMIDPNILLSTKKGILVELIIIAMK